MYTLNFEKKVALINGASRGIGEAIAKGIADCGAQLIITGRKQETIQNVADEIIKNGVTVRKKKTRNFKVMSWHRNTKNTILDKIKIFVQKHLFW